MFIHTHALSFSLFSYLQEQRAKSTQEIPELPLFEEIGLGGECSALLYLLGGGLRLGGGG
jgi:hypothetical protein